MNYRHNCGLECLMDDTVEVALAEGEPVVEGEPVAEGGDDEQ